MLTNLMPISSRHLIFCRPRNLQSSSIFWGINWLKQSIQQLYCTYFNLGTPSQGSTRKRLGFNVSPTRSVFPVACFTDHLPCKHRETEGLSPTFTASSSQVTASVSDHQASTHFFYPGWSLWKTKSLLSDSLVRELLYLSLLASVSAKFQEKHLVSWFMLILCFLPLFFSVSKQSRCG